MRWRPSRAASRSRRKRNGAASLADILDSIYQYYSGKFLPYHYFVHVLLIAAGAIAVGARGGSAQTTKKPSAWTAGRQLVLVTGFRLLDIFVMELNLTEISRL